MKFLVSSGPLCTITSAAMLLGESVQTLMDEIGHSGTEVYWPEYTDNRRFRGHCLAEVQECFIRRRLMLAPLWINPAIAPDYEAKPYHIYAPETAERRMTRYMLGFDAMVMGLVKHTRHAMAWHNNMYYDPRGEMSAQIEDFTIEEVYLVTQLRLP